MKDEVEYIIRAHCTKFNVSLVSASQIKRLINSSRGCMLMVVREKYVETTQAFQGCDSTHRKELMKLFLTEVFQEPSGFPLKHEIQHEIHLQHDASLPNIGMYRLSSIEMEEIKKQVHEFLNQGVIRPSSSPCSAPIVLVPKNDSTWRMCMDYKKLNKIMVKNQYPLPQIDDSLDQLKSVIFHKFGLTQWLSSGQDYRIGCMEDCI